jgi:hypothetical protein
MCQLKPTQKPRAIQAATSTVAALDHTMAGFANEHESVQAASPAPYGSTKRPFGAAAQIAPGHMGGTAKQERRGRERQDPSRRACFRLAGTVIGAGLLA